jgi:NADH-quinone oxidoreductase subunit E
MDLSDFPLAAKEKMAFYTPVRRRR